MQEAATLHVVMVEIGGGMFAFPAAWVQEVLPMVAPTPMPEWPEDALGLVEIRTLLIPLFDAAPLLGRLPTTPTSRHLILTLNSLNRTWGIVVDRIEGVVSAPVRELRPEDGAVSAAGVCTGLILWVQGPVVLVNPDAMAQVLRVPRMDEAHQSRANKGTS